MPRSTVWGPKAQKCWKPAVKLPWSAARAHGRETEKIGSFMATFIRDWKVTIKLQGSAVWEPKIPLCWKPAMKLPRSADWDHNAEKRPWNCQRLAVWEHWSHHRWTKWLKSDHEIAKNDNLRAQKCWNLAMKLPRSAVWESSCETAKVDSSSPNKKCGSNFPTSLEWFQLTVLIFLLLVKLVRFISKWKEKVKEWLPILLMN